MARIRDSRQRNYRLGEETDSRLSALAACLECSEADVIRRAVRELHVRLGRPADPKNNSEKSSKSP